MLIPFGIPLTMADIKADHQQRHPPIEDETMVYIKFNIPQSRMDAAKVDRLKKAFDELKAIRSEIEADWRSSNEGIGASAMVSAGFNYGKPTLNWSIDNGLTANLEVSQDHDNSRMIAHTGLNIGEKTINALLTGKLLTDEQKKALVKRLGVDLDDLSDKAGE
ncbi:hypothetical protein [Rhizobium leguminosarum]